TNALELGMDVGGLDAVVLDGYPGTVASMWQQAGRAGRQGEPSLAVLVGKDDPLDAYLLHHPADLFGRPHEAPPLDPGDPSAPARPTGSPPRPTCSGAPTRPPWSTPATPTCSPRTCCAPPSRPRWPTPTW